MNIRTMPRIVRALLVLPALGIGGCAVMGIGYGVDYSAVAHQVGVNALGADDIDPYTLQPFGTEQYGVASYGMGLDAYGYPVADWYGGWGYGGVYPGYLVGPVGVLPYAGAAVGGTPPVHVIHPHTGPNPRLRSRLGPVTRAGAAAR